MLPAQPNPFLIWLVLSAALAGLAYAFIRKELRVRATLYGSFLLACGVAVWPPYQRGEEPGKIKLGLDLRGGIQLIMRVVTDEALAATIDDAVASVREHCSRAGITIQEVKRETATSFVLTGVEPARVKDAREILRDNFRSGDGWETAEPTAGAFTVKMTDVLIEGLRSRTVKEAIKTLERRVNALGVSEPVIAEHGNTREQIMVQLAGVTDPEQAKRVMQRTAQLALKLVKDSASSREDLLRSFQGKVPDDMEVYPGSRTEAGKTFYLVRREAVITGRDLRNARVGVDENNRPAVHFTLNPPGAEKFRRETARSIGERLAIVLDDVVESAPEIQGRIGAEGQIAGSFSQQEADELAKVLRAGALPASLETMSQLTVGASLGKDSIRSGVMASAAGASFIGLFMLFYYRLSGMNAVVALAANLLILLGALAYANATLTLPGIAGIILTVGVGVDTNVLVFERIREELRNGKTVKAAINNGFERVWIIILDTHATALIAAAFLFQFGTGAIKGFAVTLFMGLVANVFASYFVSKFLFEWVLGRRPAQTLSI